MDPSIHIYNTLTRAKEPFVPRREGEVSIYVCGVTPYDDAHLGHARPAVFFDVVRKYFQYIGYRVTFVQNFTDVDDKIIQRAAERGVDPLELSRTYSQVYLDSMDRLGVARADHYPKVSEHIDEIVAMTQALVDKGAAYAKDGSVYFKVDAFPEYGKLSKQRKDELVSGVRIDPGEEKQSPLDFALWKAAKAGEPAWESPWGPGRPGWHIECSAMSIKYLGTGFDIHGGGLDLVFPHHENEIAQSEASTDEPFVRYWMHNGLVNFGDEKMSKSLGNFVTVDDLLERYAPTFLRYALLQYHYRSPIEFSDEQLAGMKRGWERLNRAVEELESLGLALSFDEARNACGDAAIINRAELAENKFLTALADDFNTPEAFAALFALARDVRAAASKGGALTEAETVALRAVLGVFTRMAGDVLGVLREDSGDSRTDTDHRLVDELIRLIVEVREEARKARDFARADLLRDRLKALGILLEDTAEGTRWTIQD